MNSPIKNADDFILAGVLFCTEEKIRQDFCLTFTTVSKNFSTEGSEPLKYLLGLLAKNFENISDRPARQFFDLLNELIDLNAIEDCLSGSSDKKIYDPEKLMSQIIDKMRLISLANRNSQVQLPDEDSKLAEVDELKVAEKTQQNERLLVGLINLTGKILQNVDAEASAKIVEQKNLIKEIFQETLFASYYQAKELGEVEIKLVQKKGSNKNKKKGASVSN